jgi:hypothetical protein
VSTRSPRSPGRHMHAPRSTDSQLTATPCSDRSGTVEVQALSTTEVMNHFASLFV